MSSSQAWDSFDYIDAHGRRITADLCAAPSDYEERLAAIMYDGVEFACRPYEFKNNPQFDPRFTQAFSELNAVAFVLAAAGYEKANLHSEKPPLPDVRAELADGVSVFVEVAEVIESPSAQLQGFLKYVNVGISKALDSDPELEKKLNGHFINVRAWMPRDGRYDPNGALDEFLGFLRTTDFMRLPTRQLIPFDSSSPSLASVDATYYHDRFDGTLTPRFETAAHSFSPELLASQVIDVLRDKQAKAASYEGSPLWLVLYISDPLGSSELSLETLRGVPLAFSPFVKLMVGDQRHVLVYTSH